MGRPKRSRTRTILTRISLGLGLIWLAALVSCGPTKLTLTRAKLTPDQSRYSPPVNQAPASVDDWEAISRPKLFDTLQNEVYGYLPTDWSLDVTDVRTVSNTAYNGAARVREATLNATARYNGAENPAAPFRIVIVEPTARPIKGVILYQSFCPNHNTVPIGGISPPFTGGFSCDGNAVMGSVMTFVFGRYISSPPVADILDAGYALVAAYPSDMVPDQSASAQVALDALTEGHVEPSTRLGAIGAWGWAFSLMQEAYTDIGDPDIPVIAFGHSRYGKAALVGTAYDPDIDMVISHQSGTGGASLNRGKRGETIADITKGYPHWFAKSYAAFAGREAQMQSEQSDLLALIAPRPILLGNARRDVWSDPNGAFRAALAASPAYGIYGQSGLSVERLDSFDPAANIAFHMRPGTHGIVKEDWPAFLAFLDAQTAKPNP